MTGCTDTLTYNWTQSNTNYQVISLPDAPNFHFVPVDDGDYYFVLMVWDDEDTSGSDFVHVKVLNAPPVAYAGPDQTAIEGSTFTLIGSGSDPGLDILSYQWQLVDSSNGQQVAVQNGAELSFVPVDNGTYTFELTVTDDDGASATDTVVVTVANSVPAISIHGSTAGVAGQTLLFQIGADDASRADIAAGFTYEIDWGDGSAVELLAGVSAPVPLKSSPWIRTVDGVRLQHWKSKSYARLWLMESFTLVAATATIR